MNIIRNTAIWILSLAAVFILYSSMASADDKFTKLEADWNAKDTLAVQENFRRTDDAVSSQLQFLADAELGQTLVIREVKRLEGVAYSAWGVNATLDGKPVKWLFLECPGSEQFCWWGKREDWGKYDPLVKAAGIDAASTALALSKGFAEGNPLGLIGGGVMKGAVMANVGNVPYDQCVSDMAAADIVWSGAGVHNMLLVLVKSHPIGLLAGVAYATINHDKAVLDAMFSCAE